MGKTKITRKDFLKIGGSLTLSSILIPKIILANGNENFINIESAKQLESIIEDNERVIANFGIMDCPHCVRYNPIFRKIAEVYPDIKFCNIIIDNLKITGDPLKVARKYRIGPLPDTIFFKGGERKYSRHGYIPFFKLKKIIDKVYY